jgi:hypothetical protein
MALMNLNLDGVLTVEKVVVPADGITALSHSLFRGEKIIVRYNGDELTRGQDFIPDRIDDRLYFQKNVCLFTALKILNESLFGQEIEVEYFACGDYINAEIWDKYPSSASLKQSLASKVDNSDFIKEVKRIDGDINKESTARVATDNTLQDNINIETNLRIAEDEKLQTNINNEATARADADNTLQDNIDKEAAARESADNEIRNELSRETDLRLAGDAALQEKIDAEMSTRAESDSSLQSQISDLKTKFESFVPGLTYKVVSSLPTADILNDVIYLVPADSTGSQNVYEEYIYIDGSWELIGTTATTQAITVDSALSETSTNPVQNKIIAAELKKMGNTNVTYYAINTLNKAKGTSIELVKGEDNTPKIMDALDVGDSFLSLFHNDSSMDRFGIDASIGNRITELHITKVLDANGRSNYCVATAFMNTGVVLNRTNYGGTLSAWVPNIDSALSSTSINPVQNKVIAAEISTLKSKAYSQEITGYTVKNSSYYKDPGVTKNMYKKNGVAFVNLQVQCLTPSDGNRVFITGLPPAAISLYFEVRSDNDVNELSVSINTSGELLLADGTQNAIYRIAFSYPIDD